MTNSFFIIKELILADFKELSRNTKDIVWTIFVPLVLTLLLGLTFGADYMQFALPGLLAISIMFLCLFGLTVSILGFSMLYLGGALFPLDASHFALRALSMINPLRYVRDIFYVTLYNPNSLNLTSVNLIAILGFGLIFLVVSLWKFRWDVLS